MVHHCRHGHPSFLHRLGRCRATPFSSTIRCAPILLMLRANVGRHRSMSWISASEPVLLTLLTIHLQLLVLSFLAEGLWMHPAFVR